VAKLQLQDLHLHGRCFTWSNERERPTAFWCPLIGTRCSPTPT
jgi:hypothetical protein